MLFASLADIKKARATGIPTQDMTVSVAVLEFIMRPGATGADRIGATNHWFKSELRNAYRF
jgi:hypothetical protein